MLNDKSAPLPVFCFAASTSCTGGVCTAAAVALSMTRRVRSVPGTWYYGVAGTKVPGAHSVEIRRYRYLVV